MKNSLEVTFKTWNWKGFSLCHLAMACFCFRVVAFSRLAGYTDLVNNTKFQLYRRFHKPMKWISYDVPLFNSTVSAPHYIASTFGVFFVFSVFLTDIFQGKS